MSYRSRDQNAIMVRSQLFLAAVYICPMRVGGSEAKLAI
jgi:hypothetical protein